MKTTNLKKSVYLEVIEAMDTILLSLDALMGRFPDGEGDFEDDNVELAVIFTHVHYGRYAMKQATKQLKELADLHAWLSSKPKQPQKRR